MHPQALDHLGALAVAGARRVRRQRGRRAGAAPRRPPARSPALIADGEHARSDGLVSLAVVASAAVVALGFPLGDPLIGLVITLVILRITWQSLQTIRHDAGPAERHEHGHDHEPAAT